MHRVSWAPGFPTDESASEVEIHDCRRPDLETGYPAPAAEAPIIHPGTIMIGGPSPGLMSNPGPPPTRIIQPAAVAERGPAVAHVRPPDSSVRTQIAPTAI